MADKMEVDADGERASERAPKIDDMLVNKTQGRPKSGRVWKMPRERTNTINKKASLISGGYAKRMVEREKQQQKKQLIAMLKAEKDVEREKERERRAQRQKQREANTLKSAQVQVIKDTSKIKKMSKRQRKHLMTAAQLQRLQAGM